MRNTFSVVALVLFVGLCLGAGYLGSTFTGKSVGGWYATLNKPSWTPPNAVFGPVWSALYLLMGIAAWLVWRSNGAGAALALSLFGAQLLLNVTWSALFFGLRSPAAGFAEICLLWLAIGATTVAFWRVTPPAAYLMLPYEAWVTFAAALNLAIWRMNA
jgi:tryptophan-rich sensory protein